MLYIEYYIWKEELQMRNKKVVIRGLVALYFIFFIWYWRLPEYVECHSRRMSAANYEETTIDIVVYKARYNKYLYDDIAERHNRMNGTPDKLVMKLYYTKRGMRKGKEPYRTIVYDYEHQVKYILIDYIPINLDE